MKHERKDIWENGEYNYEAAYGFVPNIRTYLHDDNEQRDCMLVLPGGGYCMCVPPEGEIVAKEFYNRGMNTFVLTYTTDITTSIPLKKQPLNDVARAVRFIRANAKEFNVEGKKLIICGFSAGAHVCGTLAVHFDEVPDSNPSYSNLSARPDGVILSYPVITTGEFTHIYSVWGLVGQNASEEEKDFFSLEKNVKENTPPCFIWQTETDDLVPVENSYLFANALREKKIPFAHYVFPEGFHGLSVPTEDFFKGNFGEPYTMEQVFKAVDAVKAGNGIRVSDERRKELEAQFSDNAEPPADIKRDQSLAKDAGLWPELASVWMSRL